MAIVASAGTTNTGAIDPLVAIGEIAREFSVWFHIDGAYGLPGVLDERLSHAYRGLELADSVIVDPHKWLGAAVGVAATFVHDRSLLERAFTQEAADYLEGTLEHDDATGQVEHSMDDFGVPYYNYGTELSAPCRGVGVWALIREIGVSGMRERIVRHNDMARALADLCRQHESLELLLEPTLSVCCFRYRSAEITDLEKIIDLEKLIDLDKLNQKLFWRLIRENEFIPSTTRVNGQLAIRPCFLGARIESDQVDELVQAVLRIGATLVDELTLSGHVPD